MQIPKLVVLGTSEEDDAGGLGVEGGWDVLDDRGEDLLDTLVGDWGGLGETVDGAAVGNSLEESVGTHFD